MHHTEQILSIRHDHNLMLLRAQPEQLNLIIFLLLLSFVAFFAGRGNSVSQGFEIQSVTARFRVIIVRRMRKRQAQV